MGIDVCSYFGGQHIPPDEQSATFAGHTEAP